MSKQDKAIGNQRLQGGPSLNDDMYLVDNNALSKLTAQQRSSVFFRQTCRMPSEVLHEANGFPDIADLKENEYRTTTSVLDALRRVMATVPTDDTKLVNLYANQGNADPLIVACAIDAQLKNEQLLFGPTWAIVSDDKAVQAKAREFGIDVRTSTEFVAIIDGEVTAARGQ